MGEQDKAERLAAALRDNLRKRKAQVREMAEAPPPAARELAEALEILSGPRLSTEWERAVSLIDQAAERGNAAALERRAVIECRGIGRPADWNRALETLQAAAELGSPSASAQLSIVTDGEPSSAGIAKRVQPPPRSAGRTLSQSPLVHSIEGFASARERDWLIQTAGPRLERARVYNNPTGFDPGRTNSFSLLNLAHSDLVVEMIRTRISNEIGAPLPCLEIPQVLHYRVGEEFTLHCDFLDPRQLSAEIARLGQRPMTVLIYLNDDYEGGETNFPALGINHRGKAGDALIFSNLDRGEPDERTRHAGVPPTRGEKWVLSQWVRSKAPG